MTDVTTPDLGAAEAAFIEQHPEISAVVPAWADEVELDLYGLDINGTAMFTANRVFGYVEVDVTGKWEDDDAAILDREGYGLSLPCEMHIEPDPVTLATYARRVAADLLRAAQALEEDA